MGISLFFLSLGLIDIIASFLLFSGNFPPPFNEVIGIIAFLLLIKGIWTIISSFT